MSKFVIRVIFVLVTIFAIHNENARADPLDGSLQTLFSTLDGIFKTKSRYAYDNAPYDDCCRSAEAAYEGIKSYISRSKGQPREESVRAAFQTYRNANLGGTSYFEQLPLKEVLEAWGITQ